MTPRCIACACESLERFEGDELADRVGVVEHTRGTNYATKFSGDMAQSGE